MIKSLAFFSLLVLSACAIAPTPAATIAVEVGSPAIGTDGKLTQSIGIETMGEVFTPLLQSGCTLPCATSETFSTAEDAQPHIDLRLYRGDCARVSLCTALGTFRLSGFAAKPRGQPQIEVEILANTTGIYLAASEAGEQGNLQLMRLSP